MRTTLDLEDAVLERARRRASREGTTLTAIVERALPSRRCCSRPRCACSCPASANRGCCSVSSPEPGCPATWCSTRRSRRRVLEHSVRTLISNDRDFTRFPEIQQRSID
jgi:hypothetical protein